MSQTPPYDSRTLLDAERLMCGREGVNACTWLEDTAQPCGLCQGDLSVTVGHRPHHSCHGHST
jgi:hypothetical protein